MQQQWLTVKVHPNAGKDVLVSMGPGRFEAWVKAKPMDRQANESVARLLAAALQVAPARLRLVKGRSGRQKLFTVLG